MELEAEFLFILKIIGTVPANLSHFLKPSWMAKVIKESKT